MSFNIMVSKKFSKLISSHHRGERLFLTTLRYLKLINKSIKPQILLEKAVDILRPGVKIISQVKSGRIINLPAYQSKKSSNFYILNWILTNAKERAVRQFKAKYLAIEIKLALKKRGRSFLSKIRYIKTIKDSRINLRKKFRKFKINRKNINYIVRFWNPKLKKWTLKKKNQHRKSSLNSKKTEHIFFSSTQNHRNKS